MGEPRVIEAWLEKPDGEIVALAGKLSLGRTGTNDLVLPDERVSRRHAIIHGQDPAEYWLVDLGSRNGTFVNERRVFQPVRLRESDRIQVGPFMLVFRQPTEQAGTRVEQTTTMQTMADVRTLLCWLLIVDVERSTDLAKALPAEELAVLLGRWIRHCKELIETTGGTVDKYLGDGLLAYWRVAEGDASGLNKVLGSLRRLQNQGQPAFRFVLHRATVTFGGVATLGQESLSGPEVNFVFRMEKLAGRLHRSNLVSEPAAEGLLTCVGLLPVGEHPIPSFNGLHRFFGFNEQR
jgi:adenylate cyclase